MDSVISWFVLLILTNVGFILAVRRHEEEKKQYREDNDRFFREYERNHTLKR